MKILLQKEKWQGMFAKRSLFYKALVLLLALSVITMVFFGFFMNVIYSQAQREKMAELNLLQLHRTSEELDMTFDVMSKSMSQTLYSSDFIHLMIDPETENSDLDTRAINMLKSQVATHDLVNAAFFFSPFSKKILSSNGTVLPMEDSSDREIIIHYLEEVTPPDIYTNQERVWEIMLYDNSVYLITEMTTPIFVGAMFWQLDSRGLCDIILAGANSIDYAIDVYDEHGESVLIFGTKIEKADWEKTELFIRDSGDTDGEYYLAESKVTGWRYVCDVSRSLVPMEVGSLAVIFIPAILMYALISLLSSMYITKNVYRPIQHLMKLTVNTDQPREEQQNEVDYLELVWMNSQKERERHAEVMQTVSDDVMRQLIRETLDGRVTEEARIRDTLEKIGMTDWVEGRFVVIAVSIISLEDRAVNMVENALYQRSITQLILETGNERFHTYTLVMESNLLAAVICSDPDVSAVEIKQHKSKLLRNLEHHEKQLPFRVVVGAGRIYRRFVDLAYSWQESIDDVRYQKYFAEGGDNPAEAIEPAKERHDRHYVRERMRQIFDVMSEGRRNDAERQMEMVIAEVAGRYLDAEQAKNMLETAVDEMTEFLIHKGIPAEEVSKLRESQEIENLELLEDRRAAQDKVMGFCREGIRMLGSNSKKSRYRYVEEAKAYVAEHYADSNLSLNEISDYIGITSSYLSALFAEVTQEYFSAYLNAYRIEQSKQLLDTTGQNITVIGYKCGFNSVQSFCRVFKKVTGMTPNQYREQGGNNEKKR